MGDDFPARVLAAEAAMDQYVATCGPMLRSLGQFGVAAREAGCSEAVSDALTLRVANLFLAGMFGPGLPS